MPSLEISQRKRSVAKIGRLELGRLPLLLALGLACSSETAAPGPGAGGSAGTSASGASGTAGTNTTAGTSGDGSGGAGTSGSNGSGGSAGVSANAGKGGSGGGAGTSVSGGTGGSGGGGGGSAGAAAGSSGTNASGGASAGGGGGLSGAGGAAGLGGGGGGSGGGGAGGSAGASEVASALDGLRIDMPCTGTPPTEDGAVCNHVMLTSSGGFESAESASIAGTPGTTYDVTLRIRGVVEPTNIQGGTRPNTSTFQYEGMAWRTEPLTIGGSVAAADYAQYRVHVESPEQDYWLNDYQRTGHYVFELDYEITIPVAAGSEVTLDATDSNERLIVNNYEGYAPEGIPGSINSGQFLQINVVSVVPQGD